MFDKFYIPKPDGLCGNDDCGQMSAWYIFSAMGFYPFNPCGGEYIIGAPQVACANLKVESGEFKVVARNLSRENKYVKSVTLNGKAIFIAVNTADHPVSVTVAVPGDAPRKLTLRRYEVLILT